MKQKIEGGKIDRLTWKAGKQKLVVLIDVEGRTYQVELSQSQEDSLIFILPQLFDDHIIKILPEALPIQIPNK